MNHHLVMARMKPLTTLGISCLTLIFCFWFYGNGDVLVTVRRASFAEVSIVLFFLLLNLLAVSFRFKHIVQFINPKFSFFLSLEAVVRGSFASLFVVSLFGQVTGRQLVLSKLNVSPTMTASITAIERISMFLVSGLFAVMGMLHLSVDFLYSYIAALNLIHLGMILGLSFLVSFLLAKFGFEKGFIPNIIKLKFVNNIFWILLFAFVGQFLMLAAFASSAKLVSPSTDLIELFAAAAIVSFVASLPITVNGWGIRELSSVFAFGLVGIDATSSIALAILIGLSSTGLVLLAFWTLKMVGWESVKKSEKMQANVSQSSTFVIDRLLVWILTSSAAVVIFYQLQIPIRDSLINVNVADIFAILSLAVIFGKLYFEGKTLEWIVPKVNHFLLAFGAVIVFSFIYGALTFGVTDWALQNRLLGYVVLLGYLSIGYLVSNILGREGVERFSEVLIASVCLIIISEVLLRSLVNFGIFEMKFPINFEGFSGNRNSFSFQILVCLILALVHHPFTKLSSKIALKPSNYLDLRTVAISILLLGITLTASRAGFVACVALIMFVQYSSPSIRPTLTIGVALSFFWWILIWLAPFIPGLFFGGDLVSEISIQSSISGSFSDSVRLKTIQTGLDLWYQSPFLGAGLGAYYLKSKEFFETSQVIHSTPIWLLTEFGIAGLGTLLMFSSWVFIGVLKLPRDSEQKQLFVALTLVFGLFCLVHEMTYQRIFWLGLGLSLACYRSINFNRKS